MDPYHMTRTELIRMERENLFKLLCHQETRWCIIGAKECRFFIRYMGFGFGVMELLGRGCSPNSELEEGTENKGGSH